MLYYPRTNTTHMSNDSQLSKKERVQLKKEEKAREREGNVAAAKRKNALKWIGGLIAVAAVVGLLAWASGGNDAGTVGGDDWFKGDANAPVTLIEYSDFQCPACGAYYPLIKQLHEDFGDSLKIVYRHYPLTQIHPYAQPAAAASEAAGKQGKFWEMHDKLFDNQRSWSNATVADVQETFEQYAEQLGLDVERFRADMDSREVADAIAADRAAGNRAGVRGTPTFVLQGKTISNPSGYEEFAVLIEEALRAAGVDPNAELPEDTATTTVEAVHKHADIAVFIRDQKLDLSQGKYQSTEVDHKHEYLHLHDGNGEVLHAHAKGYTLADFFGSVGITLTDECLKLDTGEEYCANDIETLTGMVNGARVDDIAGYEFNDEDRILISFGNERNLDAEMAAVTDKACIYSETCPERGEAPAEACVGGVGTNCEE